ncbi:MAG: ArsR family transcriptional regulator [Candidatus Thorarchaeota archaeon]
MTTESIDDFITLLENPTRRRILERLSHEPGYSLRIAKELGISQQLVSSHLRIMEEGGLIESELEDSTRGPKRRVYSLSKNLLITIELAPHLFDLRMISFRTEPDAANFRKSSSGLLEELELISEQNEREQIGEFADLLDRIDALLDRMERERAILLYIRNRVVHKASHIVKKIDRPNVRRVLYCILDSQDETVTSISSKLNLREQTVRSILKDLKREYAFPLE